MNRTVTAIPSIFSLIDRYDVAGLTHLLAGLNHAPTTPRNEYRAGGEPIKLIDLTYPSQPNLFSYVHNHTNLSGKKKNILINLFIQHQVDYAKVLMRAGTSIPLAKRILAAGANVHVQLSTGYSIFHALNFDPELREYLLSRGADINSHHIDPMMHVLKGCGTPLHLTLANENFANTNALIERATALGQKVNYALKDGQGKTLLLLAVKVMAPSSLIKIILENTLKQNPALINEPDEEGRTPLHYASIYGLTEVAETLIAAGADLNPCDREGITPLLCTVFNASQVEATLKSMGIDPKRHRHALGNSLLDHRREVIFLGESELKSIGLEPCMMDDAEVKQVGVAEREFLILSTYDNADKFLKYSIKVLLDLYETILFKKVAVINRSVAISLSKEWTKFKIILSNFHTFPKTEQLRILEQWKVDFIEIIGLFPAKAAPANLEIILEQFLIINTLINQREAMAIDPHKPVSVYCQDHHRSVARLLLANNANPMLVTKHRHSFFDVADDGLMDEYCAKVQALADEKAEAKRVIRTFSFSSQGFFKRLQGVVGESCVSEVKIAEESKTLSISFSPRWFALNEEKLYSQLENDRIEELIKYRMS